MSVRELSDYTFVAKYARWIPEKKRRETWNETVARYFDFMQQHLRENTNYTLQPSIRKQLERAVLKLEVMPSMRALMTSGEALKNSHIAGYNCAYIHVDSIRSFDEILYVLMNGTGIGFSVERRYTEQLPIIPSELHKTDTTIIVADSSSRKNRGAI